MDRDYEVLCTVAVADALGAAPPATSDTLRTAEWCERWLDALLGVTGTLEVGVKRMAYELGPGHPRTRTNQRRLRQLRAHTQHARSIVRARRAGPAATPSATVDFKARQWLITFLHAEFRALLAEEWTATRIDPDINQIPDTDTALFPWAVARGFLTAPVSARCQQLLQLDADSARWRTIVANDAKQQQRREPALRHPLLVARWGATLINLRHTTLTHFGYENPIGVSTHAAITAVDLRADSREEAFAALNALRFLAALAQRRYEQRGLIRQLRRVVGAQYDQAREQAGVRETVTRATDRLAGCHSEVIAFFADLLGGFADSDGKLTTAFFAAAGEIKRDAFTRAGQLLAASGSVSAPCVDADAAKGH